MIHTFGASLAEGYLAGFDRSVLGVQLFAKVQLLEGKDAAFTQHANVSCAHRRCCPTLAAVDRPLSALAHAPVSTHLARPMPSPFVQFQDFFRQNYFLHLEYNL